LPDPMTVGEISEARAVVEKIGWSSVCVVNLSAAKTPYRGVASEEIGAGTACLCKGYKLILTAGHVVGGAGPSDLGFMPRVGTAIDWEDEGKAQIADRLSLPVEAIVRSRKDDLAAIVLRPDALPALNGHFCELPAKFGYMLSGNGAVALMGYPVDQTRPVSKTKGGDSLTELRAVVPTTVMEEVVSESPLFLSSEYDPDRHLLIQFAPAEGGLKPFGYSGAGVWADNRKTGPLWVADPLLVGVETSAYVASKLLVAVKGEIVRKFLQESL